MQRTRKLAFAGYRSFASKIAAERVTEQKKKNINISKTLVHDGRARSFCNFQDQI
jgi:hypothetical protein